MTNIPWPEQNWFGLPTQWHEAVASIESADELKVLTYITHHTWDPRNTWGPPRGLSVDDITNGKMWEGERADGGVFLTKERVIRGLRQAIRDGFVVEQHSDEFGSVFCVLTSSAT